MWLHWWSFPSHKDKCLKTNTFQCEDTAHLFPGEVFLRAEEIRCDEGLPRLYWRHKPIEAQEDYILPFSGLLGFLWRTFRGRQGLRRRDGHLYVAVFRCRHLQVHLFLPLWSVSTSCCVICHHCVSWFMDHSVMQSVTFFAVSNHHVRICFDVKSFRLEMNKQTQLFGLKTEVSSQLIDLSVPENTEMVEIYHLTRWWKGC